jgi:dihydroxyacid dehydratase/phosphogluconate dehydratase
MVTITANLTETKVDHHKLPKSTPTSPVLKSIQQKNDLREVRLRSRNTIASEAKWLQQASHPADLLMMRTCDRGYSAKGKQNGFSESSGE